MPWRATIKPPAEILFQGLLPEQCHDCARGSVATLADAWLVLAMSAPEEVLPGTPPTFPGAREPERERTVMSLGIPIHVAEWGDPEADPVLLCHGFWDHLRSFAVLGPLLAQRYRVVAMDARGHGESGWAGAYQWTAWVTDTVHVLRSIGQPSYVVGHSFGGGQSSDVAISAPELVRKLVNIDGFGPPVESSTPTVPQEFRQYLDYRRKITHRPLWKPYRTMEELVQRRSQQNPRLSREWLDYFIYWASRETAHGWAWRADPQMAVDMGPWKPDWIGPSYRHLRMPMLAIVGSEPDTWGPLPETLLSSRLAHVPRLERVTIAGAGHFVHIERPLETAAAIQEFLAL